MVQRYYAYIDEAGDEGFGKLRSEQASGQSRWLLLGGIIVAEAADRELPRWRDEIMGLFATKKKERDLHFRNLKHAQKVAACKNLDLRKFGIVTVCSNKITVANSPKYVSIFKEKGVLYNYLTRFLLERVTTAVVTAGKRDGVDVELHVRFSRRGGTDYHAMHDYLVLMKDGREKLKPVRSIDWSVFNPDNIKVENHSKLAGLQIADVVTSAVAAGLEPNLYGDTEPKYAELLGSHFVRHKGTVLDCGLTLIPRYASNPLSQDQKTFIDRMISWQAPGS